MVCVMQKVNNVSNITFKASWTKAKKVLQSLPKNHKIWRDFNYSLDGKTFKGCKDVFLKRLDKAAQEATRQNQTEMIFHIPRIKDIFSQNSIKEGLATFLNEQHSLASAPKPYKFKRTVLLDKHGSHAVLKIDNLETVNIALISQGKELFKVFKKAGLESPHKITFKKKSNIDFWTEIGINFYSINNSHKFIKN